jgi:riboflavin synthase
MFTGLTAGLGRIARRRPLPGQESELTVLAGFDWLEPLTVGESIAVSGVCLTVTASVGPRGFTALASAETLARSTLGAAGPVNLERALTLNGRLGGHLVSGHIDGLGRVLAVTPAGSSRICEFDLPPALSPLVVPKGSIAIDGVSLTVNEAADRTFTVNLIPHTASQTTLGGLRPGDQVNLETDLLGKYVHRLLTAGPAARPPQGGEGLSLAALAQNGFL